MSADYQPGDRVRLTRPFSPYRAGDTVMELRACAVEGTVVELRASLMNGYEIAVSLDGVGGPLLFDGHEVELIARPTNSVRDLAGEAAADVNLRRAGGPPPEAAARRSNDAERSK